MSKIEVNQISSQCGSTLTIGQSGDTVTLASGATQSGFGRTGTVDWDTTAKTASFTAVSGNGYFVNTTSGAITVTMPASPSAGDIVSVSDYAGTAGTNNITIARNGSNINGVASDLTISKNNSAITLVYVDGTQGWKGTETSNLNDIEIQPEYIVATGGTVTCCGDYKIHTFTSPGTFTVSSVGNCLGSEAVDYLVIAGGGGGGGICGGGGGGAGGYRESSGVASGCYTASPLGACVSALPVSAQGYPVTVGGGAAGAAPCGNNNADGGQGNNSSFSTITSTGGGGGGAFQRSGSTGGSGGGGGGRGSTPGSAGNTPPVSPPQGNSGGGSTPSPANPDRGGGGGGATASGSTASSQGGAGGTAATSHITGSPVARAGGGGGGWDTGLTPAPTTGGGGAGGVTCGVTNVDGAAGTSGTGGGGGGAGGGYPTGQGQGGNGGNGIVIIRYKYQ